MDGAKDKLNHALEKSAETTEYIKAYADYQFKLKKLEIAKSVGKATATIVERIVTALLLSLALLFALIAFTVWLAVQIASYPLALLIVAGAILLILLLFSALKGVLVRKPVQNKADQLLFKEGKPVESADELKAKALRVEALLEQSAKDIPNQFRDLSAKDFLPKAINRFAESGFGRGVKGLATSKEKRKSSNKLLVIGSKIARLALKRK